MPQQDNETTSGKHPMLTRRHFLATSGAVALAGLLAACGGAAVTNTPVPAAVGAGTTPPPSASLKGTKLTILWMAPSIPEAEAAQTKNMDDWAKAMGIELTKDTVALDQWDAKLATNAQTKQGADLMNMYAPHVATNENVLLDISDIADEFGKTVGGWYDGPKSVAVRGGKWKALPAVIYG